MQEWINLVSNLGFPVALCIVYVYDSRKAREQLEKSRAALERRIENLEKESREHIVGVVNENTQAMVALNSILKGRPCLAHEERPLGR